MKLKTVASVLALCSLCDTAFGDGASIKVDDLSLQFGAFVDTYYAYDFDVPSTLDRAFTTVAARHNEFNVNLAYLDAKVSGDRIRGRFALQTGTSVTVNYADLSHALGQINGPGNPKTPGFMQNVQEATLGYQVADRLWVDAGIMFSYIGFETWISKNDWTYTRSLLADYSPYFMTGVKATYQLSDELSLLGAVMNGWDNIYETNQSKAIGLQVSYTPNSVYSLIYNNFWGDEVGHLSRFFNDFIATLTLSTRFKLAAIYDIGFQAHPSGSGSSVWQATSVQLRATLTPTYAMTLRGEFYQDPDQVIVSTGTPNGFQTWGGSVNGDLTLAKHLLWRNEFRALWSKDSVFPTRDGTQVQDSVVVTSLALSI